MSDPDVDSHDEDEPGARLSRRPATGARRWLWTVGIALAIGLIALLVVLHLNGTFGPEGH